MAQDQGVCGGLGLGSRCFQPWEVVAEVAWAFRAAGVLPGQAAVDSCTAAAPRFPAFQASEPRRLLRTHVGPQLHCPQPALSQSKPNSHRITCTASKTTVEHVSLKLNVASLGGRRHGGKPELLCSCHVRRAALGWARPGTKADVAQQVGHEVQSASQDYMALSAFEYHRTPELT